MKFVWFGIFGVEIFVFVEGDCYFDFCLVIFDVNGEFLESDFVV